RIEKGIADLNGIENEPDHREIDWLIFEKQSSANSNRNEFAVLVYPVKNESTQIHFDRIKHDDDSVHGFRITNDRCEDWIFISDGTEKRFNESIKGDFKFGWFSFFDGKIKSVSIGGLTKLDIEELLSLTLSQRNNYENAF
ncbi:hypothetical protein JXJ21_26705, partial [candidate division KSB1 bacterium]|nr:hypothetical protein [candidate division KSB1 bacterium]